MSTYHPREILLYRKIQEEFGDDMIIASGEPDVRWEANGTEPIVCWNGCELSLGPDDLLLVRTIRGGVISLGYRQFGVTTWLGQIPQAAPEMN